MKGKKKGFLLNFLLLILLSLSYNQVNASTTEKGDNSQNKNPILFIHGWQGYSTDWSVMMDWFQDDGWSTSTLYANDFDDRNNCSVQININNANLIKQWVDDILNQTGNEKIDIVGYSMGGLNSRYYIKFLGGVNKVDDYVSLGSPHHGENIAQCGSQGVNELALILNEGDETPGGVLNDITGDRIDPVSGVTYNGTHIPGNISYTSIYSLADVMPSISPPLDGANNLEVEGLSHSQLLTDKSVYELVKAAIDDSILEKETIGFEILPLLTVIICLVWFKRKK